jgi:hypothetical protein
LKTCDAKLVYKVLVNYRDRKPNGACIIEAPSFRQSASHSLLGELGVHFLIYVSYSEPTLRDR